jgi:hypothetical protein
LHDFFGGPESKVSSKRAAAFDGKAIAEQKGASRLQRPNLFNTRVAISAARRSPSVPTGGHAAEGEPDWCRCPRHSMKGEEDMS